MPTRRAGRASYPPALPWPWADPRCELTQYLAGPPAIVPGPSATDAAGAPGKGRKTLYCPGLPRPIVRPLQSPRALPPPRPGEQYQQQPCGRRETGSHECRDYIPGALAWAPRGSQRFLSRTPFRANRPPKADTSEPVQYSSEAPSVILLVVQGIFSRLNLSIQRTGPIKSHLTGRACPLNPWWPLPQAGLLFVVFKLAEELAKPCIGVSDVEFFQDWAVRLSDTYAMGFATKSMPTRTWGSTPVTSLKVIKAHPVILGYYSQARILFKGCTPTDTLGETKNGSGGSEPTSTFADLRTPRATPPVK